MTTLMSRGQATSHVGHSSLQLMPLLDNNSLGSCLRYLFYFPRGDLNESLTKYQAYRMPVFAVEEVY